MKKHIVILEDSSKVTFGGGQKGTLELLQVLKDKVDITLFDCTEKSIFQNKLNDYSIDIKFLKCYGRIVKGENSSFSVGYLEILLFPFFFLYNIFFLMKFLWNNKKNNNIIFYTSNKKHLLLLYILKKLSKIEYIFHARTYDDKNSMFYKLMIPALKNAKKIICVSHFIKNNINYDNCTVIYNPLHIDDKYKAFHKPRTLNSIVKIATLSELLKWKGIDYFIDSFKYIKNLNINKDIEFLIYGDGKEKKYLKSLITNDHIIMKGYRTDILDIMSKGEIDIIVSASISPEAFGRTTIEGCYFGIVPISSNIGAQRELIKNIDENLLFEPKNSYSLAKTIKYAIENYDQLSEKSVKFSEKFSFEIFSKKILEMFGI